jgi:hypothetical protein
VIHLRKNREWTAIRGSTLHEDAHLGEDASGEGFRQAIRTLQEQNAEPAERAKLAPLAGALLSFRVRSVEMKGRYREPYMGTRHRLGGTEMTSALCGELSERGSATRAAILDLDTFLLVLGRAAHRSTPERL